MAQELAKNLIDHRRFSFGADRVAELPLDGGKSALDIRTLMIMSKEFFLFELEVMEHFFEEPADGRGCVALQRDEAGAPALGDRLEVLRAGVGFVGGYLVDREALSREENSVSSYLSPAMSEIQADTILPSAAGASYLRGKRYLAERGSRGGDRTVSGANSRNDCLLKLEVGKSEGQNP